MIQLTLDEGVHWANVTPPGVADWSMISLIEASRYDAATAYAAVDRHQVDDFHPYIYRTHDAGKTWQQIVTGLPENAYVHAVREDPVRKGLLFAGTETGVFISFDDGNSWRPCKIICRPARSAILSFMATISSSPPTAAPSGFSTTSRRSANGTRNP